MIDYSVPYSFEISEKEDGTYEIVIRAIGFKSPVHAQEFMDDLHNIDFKSEQKTLH